MLRRTMARTLLTDEALAAGLAALPGWAREGEAIARTFAFGSYAEGVAFAVRVALDAERRDHHPDALTIGYRKVRVAYTTHDAGGLTARDLEAAGAVSALLG
ncbi:MAG: 4a-hydroxytetrahydrobiopterin dehydratase [Deltaproteobacteria bacterium]|nr:4a-hydroxytetrahydrobiopterin dehydratase [Deltaproteobacteria bacterium]